MGLVVGALGLIRRVSANCKLNTNSNFHLSVISCFANPPPQAPDAGIHARGTLRTAQ